MDIYGNKWFVLKTNYHVWDEEINNYVYAGIFSRRRAQGCT